MSRRLIGRGQTMDGIGLDVASVALDHPRRGPWWLAFAGACALIGLFAWCLLLILYQGTGVWGNNAVVVWALDIVGYDFWIGVACGALMVSAALLLLGAEWRSGLNRVAETIAVVAALAAGLYPIIHLGRPWFFYWNLPYWNLFLLWPQFRSPLVWDAFDILSYLVVALGFWYVGMLPDLAALRDRAVDRIDATGGGTLRAQLYGIAALGWRGSAVHWRRWTTVYRTLALLGVVLVVCLQTGAAVMFAGSVEPGWHDTMQPVSFLAAAVFSGVAMVAVAAVLVRAAFGLHALVTARHLEILAWLLLALGVANLYCDATEAFYAALGGDAFDAATMARRFAGPHWLAAWSLIALALVPVHAFWFERVRRSGAALACIGLLVLAGVFADHYMVIVVTLQHDFLPSSAHPFAISIWGVATFAGTVGLFLAFLLVAARYLPVVSVHGTRILLDPEAPHGL